MKDILRLGFGIAKLVIILAIILFGAMGLVNYIRQEESHERENSIYKDAQEATSRKAKGNISHAQGS